MARESFSFAPTGRSILSSEVTFELFKRSQARHDRLTCWLPDPLTRNVAKNERSHHRKSRSQDTSKRGLLQRTQVLPVAIGVLTLDRSASADSPAASHPVAPGHAVVCRVEDATARESARRWFRPAQVIPKVQVREYMHHQDVQRTRTTVVDNG